MAKEGINAAAKTAAATSAEKAVGEKVGPAEKAEQTVKAEAIEKVVFSAKDGSKHELLVKKFLFKGQRYESAKAVKENKDVLEHLVELKSRIFKKI